MRIGSGLNLGNYEWINAKPWKPVDKANLPPWLIASAAGSEDKGDVYLEPEEWELLVFFASANCSCLFQIVHNFREGCFFQRLRYCAFFTNKRATEDPVTDQYGCGWTMRFPRCKEIRHDLGIDDCLKYTGSYVSMLTCGFLYLLTSFVDLLALTSATSGKRRADEQPTQAE